ncbi:hypothetical protein F5Y04DRAFT_223301 [Hypomontagnella monticulosa]|nr:hypothetical protein F5Y04DRAFT_223301 [Hypomontagnella monticulosa]
MLFNVLSLLALGGVAAALPAEANCPRIRCMDAINECGIKWGRCYDMCKQGQPAPPPCPPSPTSITTITVPTTSLPTITSATPCSSTGTACVDYLRTCGSPPTAILTYGGCFPACGPTPTFSPPPCPEATVTETAVPTA